jgi:fructosamine-3-kinase
MFHSADYLDEFFSAVLQQALGEALPVIGYRFLSGGCIHHTLVLSTPAASYCLKYNETQPLALLQAEADGLALLRAADSLPVPAVLGLGQYQDKAWLLMEYLEAGRRRDDYWQVLGSGLALLHGHTASHFGAEADNYIGSLPQPNPPMADGIAFFVQHRLLHQAGQALLAEQLPLQTFKQLEQLCTRLPDLLPAERPALLHGDLWGGNLLVGPTGGPVLIDPAAHYGLREAELAFTHLFGGFDDAFYQSYQEAFPLEPGFARRRPLYNLYPLLVHLRLFGSGYLAGIEQVITDFA